MLPFFTWKISVIDAMNLVLKDITLAQDLVNQATNALIAEMPAYEGKPVVFKIACGNGEFTIDMYEAHGEDG